MKQINKIKKNAWRQDKIHLDFQKSSIQLCGIEKYNTYFIAISCTISTVSFCWWQKHRGPSSNRCSTLKQRILTEVSVLENQRLQLQFLFKSQRIVQCQLHGHVGLCQSLRLMEAMTFICGRKLREGNLHNDYLHRVRRGHCVRLQLSSFDVCFGYHETQSS